MMCSQNQKPTHIFLYTISAGTSTVVVSIEGPEPSFLGWALELLLVVVVVVVVFVA